MSNSADPSSPPVAYFDNNATTPLDPRVRDAMLPWLSGLHGNPSSAHGVGKVARRAVETARRDVALLLGGKPSEVVFTASGSESNNMVIRSLAEAANHRGHFVFSTLEHPSVRAAIQRAVDLGMEATELRPGSDGVVSADAVEAALREDTRLVCLMQANNELGTLQPVREVATVCRRRGIPVLCDAVQGVGKLPLDAHELGVDFITLGGHKFHGPLGCAVLWIRSGHRIAPLVLGASQEGGHRAGTENVPGIVGLGVACRLAHEERARRHEALLALRRQLEDGLRHIDGAVVHCDDTERLPHTTHVAFTGISGHELMMRLDGRGFAVSTGSACHSGRPQASRNLVSMGIPEAEALASLRISFGITNRAEEVTRFLAVLAEEVPALRQATSQETSQAAVDAVHAGATAET